MGELTIGKLTIGKLTRGVDSCRAGTVCTTGCDNVCSNDFPC